MVTHYHVRISSLIYWYYNNIPTSVQFRYNEEWVKDLYYQAKSTLKMGSVVYWARESGDKYNHPSDAPKTDEELDLSSPVAIDLTNSTPPSPRRGATDSSPAAAADGDGVSSSEDGGGSGRLDDATGVDLFGFDATDEDTEAAVRLVCFNVTGSDNKDDSLKRGQPWRFDRGVVKNLISIYKEAVREDSGGPPHDGDDDGDDDDDDDGGEGDDSAPGGRRRPLDDNDKRALLNTLHQRIVYYMNWFHAKITGEGKEGYIIQMFWEHKLIKNGKDLRRQVASGDVPVAPPPVGSTLKRIIRRFHVSLTHINIYSYWNIFTPTHVHHF